MSQHDAKIAVVGANVLMDPSAKSGRRDSWHMRHVHGMTLPCVYFETESNEEASTIARRLSSLWRGPMAVLNYVQNSWSYPRGRPIEDRAAYKRLVTPYIWPFQSAVILQENFSEIVLGALTLHTSVPVNKCKELARLTEDGCSLLCRKFVDGQCLGTLLPEEWSKILIAGDNWESTSFTLDPTMRLGPEAIEMRGNNYLSWSSQYLNISTSYRFGAVAGEEHANLVKFCKSAQGFEYVPVTYASAEAFPEKMPSPEEVELADSYVNSKKDKIVARNKAAAASREFGKKECANCVIGSPFYSTQGWGCGGGNTTSSHYYTRSTCTGAISHEELREHLTKRAERL